MFLRLVPIPWLLAAVAAFTNLVPLHPQKSHTTRPAVITVYGFRTFLQRTFGGANPKPKPKPTSNKEPASILHVEVNDTVNHYRKEHDNEPQLVSKPVVVPGEKQLLLAENLTMTTTTTTATATATAAHVPSFWDRGYNVPPSPSLHSSTAWKEKDTLRQTESTFATTKVATLDPLDRRKSLEQPLYTVAPVNHSLTTLEREFRNMLESFSNYSRRDIMSLKEENVRVLFEGVAAAAHETAVYRAFEVLFEDLYPLRVAARVIYSKLQKLMQDSKLERQRHVDHVVQRTGLDPWDVEATWLLFVSTASRINAGGAYLTRSQLDSIGFMEITKQRLHPAPIEALTEALDEAKGGRITFTDFAIALHECTEQECSLERRCDSLELLQDILYSIGKSLDACVEVQVDLKKLHYGDRYDEMLDAFRHWSDLVPEGTGRRMDVIRGCFVGAENKQVVKALRICYVDYAGLRMAAEIIFKLVKTFMASREKDLRANVKAKQTTST